MLVIAETEEQRKEINKKRNEAIELFSNKQMLENYSNLNDEIKKTMME